MCPGKREKLGVSGYDKRLYALMLAATNMVLSWTVTQPIFSLYVTERGAPWSRWGCSSA